MKKTIDAIIGPKKATPEYIRKRGNRDGEALAKFLKNKCNTRHTKTTSH